MNTELSQPKAARIPNLPPPDELLFDSRAECHQELLELFDSVMQEMKERGEKLPSFRRFYADFRACFETWQKYAPR